MDRFELETRLYPNKRLAVVLMEGPEQYAVLTTNLVHATLADDEVCIPQWNFEENMLAAFLASGKFEDTGRTEPAGHVDAPVWRVLCPEILEAAARQRAAAQ
ncbi:hypothetical protein F2S72_08980 [Pseudomonas syringae pv. actinidiae]|nr:hypothetical protein [Pseudomonas syringae pv. actinidiae]